MQNEIAEHGAQTDRTPNEVLPNYNTKIYRSTQMASNRLDDSTLAIFHNIQTPLDRPIHWYANRPPEKKTVLQNHELCRFLRPSLDMKPVGFTLFLGGIYNGVHGRVASYFSTRRWYVHWKEYETVFPGTVWVGSEGLTG